MGTGRLAAGLMHKPRQTDQGLVPNPERRISGGVMYTSMNRSNAQRTPGSHDCDHGFCSVCGMVWPCSWARRHAVPVVPAVPIPRLEHV